MKNLQIRSCTATDFASVFELLRQLWPNNQLDYAKLQIVYERALKSDCQRLIVGVLDQQVIGFCSLTIKNNLWQAGYLGHIEELVVDGHFRGQGIGRMLIDEITRIAKELQCIRIELNSGFHRKEAHQFYETLGYESRALVFSKKVP